MKKIILLFVSVIFLLVSCNENKGINVPTSDSINETASTIREELINGYWRGDLSEYFKDGNFDVTLKSYKDSSYYNVMQWLDKKK